MFLAWLGCSPLIWNQAPSLLPSYASGPRHQWLGPFLREGLVYVGHLLGALSSGGQACASAWRDWISFSKVSPGGGGGTQLEVPLKGNILGYTCNHGSPRGNETLRPLAPSPCLRPTCLRLLRQQSW